MQLFYLSPVADMIKRSGQAVGWLAGGSQAMPEAEVRHTHRHVPETV